MKKLDVLLLGWEFPPLTESDSGVACYEMAKELAGQVNLSLILPKTDPDFVLTNVELTGLNNINLQATPAPVAKPTFNTFAEPKIAASDIKLYGAPTYTGQEQLETQTPATEQPGAAATVGELGINSDATGIGTSTSSVEELNIFGQTDFSQLDYNTQVIHYARYATRLAAQKEYDVIYAYDWLTYLAGVELKLLSGKLMVVHVQSLSDDRGGPDSKGWVYEMEKQALEKADFVIAHTHELAAIIETEYNIPVDKIRSIGNLDQPLPEEVMEEANEIIEAAQPEPIVEERELALTTASSEPLDWQEAASNIVSVLQKLLGKTALVTK